MNKILTEHGFVIYDNLKEGFFSGYLNWGSLHGITKNIANAKPFESRKEANDWIGHILKNIDDLNRDFDRKISNYNADRFEVHQYKREISIFSNEWS